MRACVGIPSTYNQKPRTFNLGTSVPSGRPTWWSVSGIFSGVKGLCYLAIFGHYFVVSDYNFEVSFFTQRVSIIHK